MHTYLLILTLACLTFACDGEDNNSNEMPSSEGEKSSGGTAGNGDEMGEGGTTGNGDETGGGGADAETEPEETVSQEEVCLSACESFVACDFAIEDDEGNEAPNDLVSCQSECNEALSSPETPFEPAELKSCIDAHVADNICDEEAFNACLTRLFSPAISWGLDFGDVICDKRRDCCPETASDAFDNECDFIGAIVAFSIGSDVEEGFAIFDVDAGAACLDAIRMAVEITSCENLNSAFDAVGDLLESAGDTSCDQMLVPQQTEGDVCGTVDTDEISGDIGIRQSDNACQEGLACVPPSGTDGDSTELPTCQPVVAIGDTCKSNDDCDDTAFCGPTSEARERNAENESIGSVCQARKTIGENCNALGDECESGYCAQDEEGNGVCTDSNDNDGELCTPAL